MDGQGRSNAKGIGTAKKLHVGTAIIFVLTRGLLTSQTFERYVVLQIILAR